MPYNPQNYRGGSVFDQSATAYQNALQRTDNAVNNNFNLGQSGAFQNAMQGTNRAANFNPGNLYNSQLQSAVQGTRRAANFNPGQQYQNTMQSAIQGTRAGMNYQPQTAAQGIGRYQDPYENQVVRTAQNDLERQRQMAINDTGAAATRAGAFGGSRHGAAEALTNLGFGQQGQQMAAGLRSQGFNTALGASQQDVANRMQGEQMNLNAANQMGNLAQQSFGNQLQQNQFGLNAANQQANLAQQSFGNRLQQNQFGLNAANQQANLAQMQANNRMENQQFGLNAANQLANLSQQGFNMGMGLNQQQWQQGQAGQQMNQALIDAARNQYQGFTNAPQEGLQTYQNMLGTALGSAGSETTSTNNPGLFDFLPMIGLL